MFQNLLIAIIITLIILGIYFKMGFIAMMISIFTIYIFTSLLNSRQNLTYLQNIKRRIAGSGFNDRRKNIKDKYQNVFNNNPDGQTFREAYETAPTGYKTETILKAMLNKYVDKGQFVERNDLPWLSTQDVVVGTIPLEIDGYNEEIGVAFEFQGPKHYKNIFRQLPKYINSAHNDDIKKTILGSAERNVKLIIVHHDIRPDLLINYVKSRLKDIGHLNPAYDQFNYVTPVAEPVRQYDNFIRNIKSIDRSGANSIYYMKNGEVFNGLPLDDMQQRQQIPQQNSRQNPRQNPQHYQIPQTPQKRVNVPRQVQVQKNTVIRTNTADKVWQVKTTSTN
jgi:hypothetical protein